MSIDFIQDGPVLKNTFRSDLSFQSFLNWKIQSQQKADIFQDLDGMGELARTEWLSLAKQAEAEPPRLRQYDPWGTRIDQLELSPAWSKLSDIAALEGIVSTAYDRTLGPIARMFQMAKLYMYHPSSAFFSCPLAMTDGAARVLELYGLKNPELKKAFTHLTSRDPEKFWTSGQWMTEKTGGSDVSQTSTVVKNENGVDRLYGIKWFSSSTASQMALALARKEGAAEGSKGLTLYYVETHRKSADKIEKNFFDKTLNSSKNHNFLNNIKILRLKDKLGTKALPTAELELCGTPAIQIGEEAKGVRTVATMLNITRLYNSVCSVAHEARMIQLLTSYSEKRMAFGKKIIDQVLHRETLAKLYAKHMADVILTFSVIELLGKEECGTATEKEKQLLRLMTPIVKLMTAQNAMQVAADVLEAFGGVGYIEDLGIASFFRDARVFSIWEGTTNVLSLDVLRVLSSEGSFMTWVEEVKPSLEKEETEWVDACLKLFKSEDKDLIQSQARSIAFGIGTLWISSMWKKGAQAGFLSKALFSLWSESKSQNLVFFKDNRQQHDEIFKELKLF